MKKGPLLSLFFLCLWINLYGQSGYSVRHYTGENGLPQNSVKGISSDEDGFMWLGTEDGLVRFDGHRFEVFNSSNLRIGSNRVSSIRASVKSSESTQKGRTERAKVVYAKFESLQVARIEGGQAVVDSLYYENRDRCILALKLGVDLQDITYVAGLPDLVYTNSSENGHHMIMAGGGEGNFFMVSKSKVTYYQDWKRVYQCTSPGGELWNYFSIGKRLYYRQSSKKFTQIFNGKLSEFTLSGDIEKDADYREGVGNQKFYWNGNSEQAFQFCNDKLYLLIQQKDGSLSSTLLVDKFNLLVLGIDVIYFDSVSRSVFLGSRIDGLYILSKTQFSPVISQGGIGANVFYAQVSYSRNTVIIPTGSILGKEPVSGRSIDSIIPSIAKVSSSDKRVMLKTRNGTIWMKRWDNLIRLDKALNPVKVWKFDQHIVAMCEGAGKEIWVGTLEKRLYRCSITEFEVCPRRILNDSLKEITCIEAHGENEILVGTAQGLFRLNTVTETSRLIAGTKGIYIKSIGPSENGRVWITGQENGLMLWTGNGAVSIFPLDQKRYLASPHCALDDGLGYLWITTNKGLFQVNKNDLLNYTQKQPGAHGKPASKATKLFTSGLYYHYHAKDEGFNTNEFNGGCQPCGVKLDNGFISLASLNGLIWFQPEKILNYVPDERIILDRVEVNGEKLSFANETIDFPEGAADATVYFATAYFGNTYNLNVYYALVRRSKVPESSDWIRLKNDELTVQLSGLHSGEYSLYIRKNDGFGLANYGTKQILLNFPRKWYENPWMIFIIIVMFAAFFVLLTHSYNRYKLRTMMARNAELEKVIALRTEKLGQTLLGLQASRKDMDQQIYLLSRIVASISHDVQSPLKYLSFASKRIPDLVKSDEMAEVSKVSSLISDMSDRMSTMLTQLVTFAKAQVYGEKMKFETVDIHQLIQEKIELFNGTIQLNGSKFYNNIPEGARVDANHQLLSIIIHNLLDNAVKYTLRGEIYAYLNNSDGYTEELIIANSGANVPDHIFEIMNSTADERSLEELVSSREMKGLGLLIVIELASLCNITVRVSQTDFVRFHLRLPKSGTVVKNPTEME